MKSINALTKRELVDVCKRMTGNGGDYARTSIDTYRDRVKTLRKAQPDQVDAILAELTGDMRLDKDARIKQLEDALRSIREKGRGQIINGETLIAAWVVETANTALGDLQ